MRRRFGALPLVMLLAAALLMGSALAAWALVPNDDFANAISLGSATDIEVTGNNLGATRELGEFQGGGGVANNSVWYTWTAPGAPATGTVGISLGGSEFDTYLSVFTGSAVTTLTKIVFNDDLNPNNTSLVSWVATANVTYRIQVDSFSGETGNYKLHLCSTGPPNDLFTSPIVLSGALPIRATGHNVRATKETGELDHGGNQGGASAWWSWAPATTGRIYIGTQDSDIDTLLGIYTGDTTVGAAIPVTSDINHGPFGTSYVSFIATAGTTYRIAVDGFYSSVQPEQGDIVVNIGGAPPNDDFAARRTIPGDNATVHGDNFGAGAEAGEPAHSGETATASVWWSWTPSFAGTRTVSISTIKSDFFANVGVYTGSAVGALTKAASAPGSVAFAATGGTSYAIAVDAHGGDHGHVDLAVMSGPANDMFSSAEPLSGSDAQASGANEGATKEPGEPRHAGDLGGASVWYSWTPSFAGPVTIDTARSTFDTLLGVYTGSAVGSLTEVASDDDGGPKGTSLVTFSATAGATYMIAVDGWRSFGADPRPAVGFVALSVNQPRVATPTFAPAPGTYNFGQAVTISCATPGASIRFTTNGSEPGASSPVAAAPVVLTANTTLKAKAFKAGVADSVTMSGLYKIRAFLSKPTLSPSTPRRNVSFTVTGFLKPRHPGTTKLLFYRKIGSRYVLAKTVLARNGNFSTYTRFRATGVRLAQAGSWQVRASHSDSSHVASFSPIRSFKVR